MTSLIINMPHLQSRRQRHGAMLLSGLCWAWFLMPTIIVGGWLMGYRVFAQEVVWLGGWQSLLRLSEEAVSIIAGLSLVWTGWTLFDLRRSRPRRAPTAPEMTVAAALGAEAAKVRRAMSANLVTITFTADGKVANLVTGIPAAEGVLDLRVA